MKFFSRYVDYLHLKREKITDLEVPKYKKVKKNEVAKLHLSYLKEQNQFQRERQANIENKNSQLVGQASIIVSIITLFVPLLIDKLPTLHFGFSLILIIGFLFVLVHYLIAIIHSIKTLQINHYYYSSGSVSTITKSDRATSEGSFYHEEISDLIYSIEKNASQNNRKGRNLVYATRSFRIATVGLVIYAISIVGLSLTLGNPSKVIEIDSVNNSIIEQLQESHYQIIEKLQKLVDQIEYRNIIYDDLSNTDSLSNSVNVDSLGGIESPESINNLEEVNG